MTLLEDMVSHPIEGAVLVMIAAILIYALLVVGQVLAPLPGGQQAQSIANSGVAAIIAIVAISGIAGTIAFGKDIVEAIEGIFGGSSDFF